MIEIALVIAIGLMGGVAVGTQGPIAHTVALLDWALGGPVPRDLQGRVPAVGANQHVSAAAE